MRYECEECGFVAIGDDEDLDGFDLVVEDHEERHRVDAELVAQVGHDGWCDCRGCCERRSEPAPAPAWSSQAGLSALRHRW